MVLYLCTAAICEKKTTGCLRWDIAESPAAEQLEYLVMTWCYNTIGDQYLVRWWDSGYVAYHEEEEPYPFENETEYHIVFTLTPGAGASDPMRITCYHAPSAQDDLGSEKAFLETTDDLSDLNDADYWLGRSHRDTYPTANASYNEVRIWSGALSSNDLELLHDLGPNI